MLPLLVLALAVGGQSPPAARVLTGTVLDPGDLPVAAAEVRLRCDAAERSTSTDRHGAFFLRVDETERRCLVRVSAIGFAPADVSLDDRGNALLVRLRLQTHEEHLTVRGDADPFHSPRASMAEGDLLREFVTRPNDMLDYARALAGSATDRTQIVVDGSRRNTLPAAARIDRIVVNEESYSVLYSGLDGARIDVETMPLKPAWSYTATIAPGTIVGTHPLGAGHQARTRSGSASVSGPLVARGLAWSAGASHSRREQEVPLLTPRPGNANTASTEDDSTDAFGAIGFTSSTTRVALDVAFRDARLNGAGAGGLVSADAATDEHARTVETHASVRRQTRWAVLKSSGTVAITSRDAFARSIDQGTSTIGGAVTGGAAISSDATRTASLWWTMRVDSRARGKVWRIGFDVSASSAHESFVPNSEGALLLAPAPDGTSRPIGVVLDRGAGEARAEARGAAAYGEVQWWNTPISTLTAGARIDVASRDRPALQPRVSGMVRLGTGRLSFGVGRFVEDWAAETLLPLWARAAPGVEHLAQYAACLSCGPLHGTTVVEIARQRQTVASIGIQRAVRRVNLSGEYRWSATERVPSLLRALKGMGWIETFGSDGRQRQDEIRTRAGFGPRTHSLVAHYTWRHARETTDGWYGSPVTVQELALWAPAASLPTHEGGFVFSMRTQGGTSVSAVGSVTSGRPVDFVLSPQTLAEALLAPRRPGLRNAGLGPNYAGVSLYASQRVGLPLTRARGRLGAQVVNLLGRRNLLAPVAVVDSPFYGRATTAAPGRALSVWFSLEQR